MAITMKNAVFWDVDHVALVRTDVSEERYPYLADSCQPDDGSDTFPWNVCSYKSHTA
jgi:hypothetical protein